MRQKKKTCVNLTAFYFQAGMEYLFSVQRANCLEDFLITIAGINNPHFLFNKTWFCLIREIFSFIDVIISTR